MLTLDAVRNITIDAAISGADGGLTLTAGSGGSISTGSGGTVAVGIFDLTSGNWSQIGSSLPSFSATDFRFDTANASFIRALGGDGSAGTPYQIADIYGLQGLASQSLLGDNSVLAKDVDASGTASWNSGAGFQPIGVLSNSYSGTFDGQGHAISSITINRPTEQYVGLFGYTNGAALSNVVLSGGSIEGLAGVGSIAGGLANGTVTSVHASTDVTAIGAAAATYVGGLVGVSSQGTIYRSSASGNVTGLGGVGGIGGLVGITQSSQPISQSYATGTVTGGAGTIAIGGLVGANSGPIADSFATGNVIGAADSDYIGGLIGEQYGTYTVSTSYSTGQVSGGGSGAYGGYAGGFLGYNSGDGSYFTNDYWDTQTSGMSSGVGHSDTGGESVTGKTTAQLQGALPAGFSSSIWGTGSGLYPYFKWQYASTPVAISGMAYSDAGATGLGGAHVNVISNGASVGTVTTASNGYYYLLAAAGSVDTSGILAYLDGNGVKGAAFRDNVSGLQVTGLDIYGSALTLATLENTLSATLANLVATFGAYSDSDLAFISAGATQLTSPGYGLYLRASSGYTFDRDLASGGLLSLAGTGSFTIDADRMLTSGGTLTLDDAIAWNDASTLTLSSSGDIALDAAVTAANGRLNIGATGTIATGSSGTVAVGLFDLISGSWSQIGASLPGFSATDFRFDPANANFLRALAGDGTAVDPYQLNDVYGLQGMAAYSLLDDDFMLAVDIDASVTAAWNAGAGFLPIGKTHHAFTGLFDGRDRQITGLTIDRPAAVYVGLFGLTENATLGHVVLSGGTVTGLATVGSLAGGILNSSVTAVRASTDVSAVGTVAGTYVGGLVGGSDGGTISQSSASGNVTGLGGLGAVGGLVGINRSTHAITQSYATGKVTGGAGVLYIGGLIGQNSGPITNSYASGNVIGAADGNYIGGFIGENTDDYAISSSFSIGRVSGGGSYLGGFLGYNAGHGTFFASDFWDMEASGQSVGVGHSDYGDEDVAGRTTAQMHSLATFTAAGWDIDDVGGTGAVWRIYDGYTAPILRSFLTPLTVTVGDASKTYDGAAYTGGYSSNSLHSVRRSARHAGGQPVGRERCRQLCDPRALFEADRLRHHLVWRHADDHTGAADHHGEGRQQDL